MSRRSGRFQPVKPIGQAPRRVEGIRWLRSDGTPNFSNRVRERESEIKYIATRPVIVTSPTAPVLEACESIYYKRIRALPVVNPGSETVEGLLTVMDLVDYLGGGEKFRIIELRHKNNMFTSLREPVDNIMSKPVVTADWRSPLTKVLELMVTHSLGVVPITDTEGRIWGILTEHDIVRHLMEKTVGVPVKDIMSRNVITISLHDPLGKAGKLMVTYGFRRLPVVENGGIVGMLTAKDYVYFFGSHEAFRYSISGSINEVLDTPVENIMGREVYTISPDEDAGNAATLMASKGVSSLLVVENGELKGIITERDILYALASS